MIGLYLLMAKVLFRLRFIRHFTKAIFPACVGFNQGGRDSLDGDFYLARKNLDQVDMDTILSTVQG